MKYLEQKDSYVISFREIKINTINDKINFINKYTVTVGLFAIGFTIVMSNHFVDIGSLICGASMLMAVVFHRMEQAR